MIFVHTRNEILRIEISILLNSTYRIFLSSGGRSMAAKKTTAAKSATKKKSTTAKKTTAKAKKKPAAKKS
jgi:hypothetical protein